MRKTIVLAALAAALQAGCDSEPALLPMPVVNGTNCQIEAIKKLQDKATRETFAGLCSRRTPTGSGIAPTEQPMNWLELADPKDHKGVKP